MHHIIFFCKADLSSLKMPLNPVHKPSPIDTTNYSSSNPHCFKLNPTILYLVLSPLNAIQGLQNIKHCKPFENLVIGCQLTKCSNGNHECISVSFYTMTTSSRKAYYHGGMLECSSRKYLFHRSSRKLTFHAVCISCYIVQFD